MQAPSGANLPWPYFVAVTDRAKRAAFAGLYLKVFFEEYAPTISAERRKTRGECFQRPGGRTFRPHGT